MPCSRLATRRPDVAAARSILRAVSLVVVPLAVLLFGAVEANALLFCGSSRDCSDGNRCTIDLCFDLTCKHGPLSCDDHDPCTEDSCDLDQGCVHTGPSCVTTTSVPPPPEGCGDPGLDGEVEAGDARRVLRAAVGVASCDSCHCDVSADGIVTVTDALAILRFAVGIPVRLDCPPC